MKNALTRLLVALGLIAALTVPAYSATGIGGSTLQPGDSSNILGVNPTFTYGAWLDQYGTQYKAIVDSTSTTPAPVGKIVYWTGTTWIQAATANLAVPQGMYGVIVQAAPVQGGVAFIQTRGLVSASVKTGGSVACAATGDVPLAITTTGDLTPTAAASVPGVTWGTCASVLAISTTATLIKIYIGTGY